MKVEIGQETYLGDGLYASLDDSGQIRLRAPRADGDDLVYLEVEVFRALVSFAREAWSPIWSKIIDP